MVPSSYESSRSHKGLSLKCYAQKRFPGNLAVYEVMWKNVVEPDKPQITI